MEIHANFLFQSQVQKYTYDPVWNQTFNFNLTSSSKSIIEIELINVANPNISGPAAGNEKIGE